MISSEKIIDPRHLQIGNLLSYKGEVVHVTFLSLDIDDEYQETIGFCKYGKRVNEKADWNRALAGDLEPIPLTPEILEKCGFEKNEEDSLETVMISDKGTPIKKWLTSVSFCKNFMTLRQDRERYYYVDKPGCEVKYVHQLQNLYFALTGEELQVTI